MQYVVNNMLHSLVKTSPSKLLLGFDQRNHADNLLIQYLCKIAKTFDFDQERESCRKLALNVADKIKNYNKLIYDKRYKKPTAYKPKDLVLIRNSTLKPGENKKLKSVYKGPYKVYKSLR